MVDRWGGNALNYAPKGSNIEKELIKKGAKLGSNQDDLLPPRHFNLSDNDFRLLFAASQGNMRVLEILKFNNWKVIVHDLDGRTPLHLAASSKNLQTVKFLV
jgi:ankyrin repeat protein